VKIQSLPINNLLISDSFSCDAQQVYFSHDDDDGDDDDDDHVHIDYNNSSDSSSC
jgi:hypothetical protein